MRRIFVCTFFSLALALRALVAAPGDLLLTLHSPSPQPGAHFGQAAANVAGNIVVGEPSRLVNNEPFIGASYIFDGRTGELARSIPSPSQSWRAGFGSAVTPLSNGFAIGTGHAERVFVYEMDGDYGFAIAPPPGRPGGGSFGGWLASIGDTIVTADPSEGIRDSLNSGAAYLFDGITGEMLLHISNPEPQRQKPMGGGLGVGAFGSNILIGSFLQQVDGQDNVGSVFLFDGGTGDVLNRFDNPNPDSADQVWLSDWFGWSLAGLGDNRVIVGAQEDDPEGVVGAGTVYVFDATTGELALEIPLPDLLPDGEFGRSVAAVGENILVGAWQHSGSAYLFDGQSGELLLRIPNPEPDDRDQFGWHVAAFGNDILVGDPTDGADGVPDAGTVYLFEGPQPAIDGDFNADGRVDQADLDLVLMNWGKDGLSPPDGWVSNLPGMVIEQRELDEVLLGWGDGAVFPAGPAGRVSEPTTAGLMACTLATLFSLRRFCRSSHPACLRTV